MKREVIGDDNKTYILKDEYTCPKCGEEIQGEYKGEYYCGSCDTQFEPKIRSLESVFGEPIENNKLNKITNMEKIRINKESSVTDEFQDYEEYCEMEDIEPADSGNLDVFLQTRNRGPEYDKAMRDEFHAWFGNMTGFDGNDELITSGLKNVFSGSVEDSTDVWKSVRQYMLSRIKERYDTKQEMVDDINSKYKSVMESLQGQFNSWFENELQANPSVYNIEILGEDGIVDESQMGLNSDDEDIVNEQEMGDNNDELNLDDSEEEGF